MNSTAMHNNQSQRGYVLLVSLALVVIAAMTLASVARHSMDQASAALRAQEDLQVRWGTLSLKRALQPNMKTYMQEASDEFADKISRRKEEQKLEQRLEGELEGEEETRSFSSEKRPIPPRSLRFEKQLGEIAFTVVLRDESARLNVNYLYKQLKKVDKTKKAIDSLLQVRRQQSPIDLKPHDKPTSRTRNREKTDIEKRMFNSFTQVMPNISPQEMIGPNLDDTGLIEHMTCWGSGRLNIKRATWRATETVLKDSISESDINIILERRDTNPAASIELLLDKIPIKNPTQQNLNDILTDSSDCYSLWITTRSRNRTRHDWTIKQTTGTDKQPFEFQW